MQDINDKDGKLIGISYDSIIKRIKAAKSIKEKLEWFLKLPIVFWTFESMKQILGPFATMAALKMWDSLGSGKNFPSLNAVFNNKKKVIKAQPILETMSAFLKRDIKVKLSDFGNLSQEQISDGLYCLIKEGIIENTQDLKKYCDKDLESVLSTVILKLVLEDLDFMFENKDKNKGHSEIARKFGISDSLTVLVITNYIACVSYEEGYCYDIENYLKTEEEKWMAEVVFCNDNVPDIKPVHVLKYLALLSDKEYNFNDDDVYLYMVFFESIRPCIEIKDNRFSGWNLDLQRKLFLISCTFKSVWGFSLKDGLKNFLATLEWDEEEIVAAFTNQLAEKEGLSYINLYDSLTNIDRFRKDALCLGIKMFRPIIRAIMNGAESGEMEEFLQGFLFWSGGLYEEEVKSGIEVCFNEIDKLNDYKKITSVVAFVEMMFTITKDESLSVDCFCDDLLGEALYQENGKLKNEIKQVFDKAFEGGISSSDLCSYDLLKMVEHRKILGLTNEQIKLIRDRALKLDRTEENTKKLFKLFDTKELKIILGNKTAEDKIFDYEKEEPNNDKSCLDLEEKPEEDKNKNKNGNKSADARKSVRKKMVLRKIKNKPKPKPNMMLDKKRYRDQKKK